MDRWSQLILSLLLPLAVHAGQIYTPAQSLGQEPANVVRDIRLAVNRLIKEDDKKSTWFVPVGVSPLVFAADLESRGARVIPFPISSAGQTTETDFPVDRTFLDAYIEHWLKPAWTSQPSKMVFIDYGISGKTLASIKSVLTEYCARKDCGRAERKFIALTYDPTLPHGKVLDGLISISLNLDNLLLEHHFDYLRISKRQSARQWIEWVKENKITSEQAMRGGIAQRIAEMSLPEGIKNYEDAVRFFKSAPPAETLFERIWRRCAEILKS
jgi:hypothetical protein